MITDNVAKMTPEHLRDELALAQVGLNEAKQYNELAHQCVDNLNQLLDGSAVELTQTCTELAQAHIELRQIRKLWLNPAGAAQIRADFASAKMRADEWFDKLIQARADLVHVQTEAARLGTALADACAARDALARECNELEEAREYNAGLVEGRDRTIAHVRQELEDLQGASREYGRQLADVTANREFWYKKAQGAEVERDKWRMGWESVTAELLNAQTDLKLNAKMLADQCDQAREAENERDEAKAELDLARQAMQEQSDEVQESWLSPAEAEGLKRQLAHTQNQLAAARRAAEWLWGFYDGNTLIAKAGYTDEIDEAWGNLLVAADSTPDAIQLQERLATLDAAEAALADCGITGIYDDFSSPANAIKQMVERLVQLEGGQALQNERRLRQEAEQVAKSLHLTITDVREALNECGVEREGMSTHARVLSLGQRATRAEALAQLVTPGLADLLVLLACATHASQCTGTIEDAKTARKLAAEIGEVLDGSQA